MHPTILAQRKAIAVHQIVTSASALAHGLDLDPVLIDALQPKGIKDPSVIEMMRLEGVAELLQVLAIRASAVQAEAPVPAETPADEAAAKPMDESIPAPAPMTDETGIEQPMPEDVSTATPARKPRRKSKSS